MKKVLLWLVILSLISVPIKVSAAPSEDLRWVVDSKIRTADEGMSIVFEGQDGLLRYLQFLTMKIMWVEFSEIEEHGLEYGSTALKEFRDSLKVDIQKFNDKFGQTSLSAEDPSYFKPLKLPLWNNDHMEYYEEYIKSTIPNYIEALVKPLVTKYSSLNESDQAKFLKEKSSTLMYSYRVLSVLADTESEFYNLVSDGLKSSSPTKARELLSNNSSIQLLIQRGKEIDLSSAVIGGSDEVAFTGDFITRLAHVELKPNDDLAGISGVDLWRDTTGSSNGFVLQETYLKLLSAGAIYRPFISKTGDVEYIEALRGLYNDDLNKAKIVDLYQNLKELKKPLLITTKDDYNSWFSTATYTNDRVSSPSGDYVGVAKVVRLKEFIDLIDSKSNFGLVVAKGKLSENLSDMNSFSYFSDNPTDTSGLVIAKGTEEQSGALWTAPVLMFNGAENNTKDVVGAMTTYLLRQAKANIVDITSVYDERPADLLFMNALGDIVLSDNTIVLPAIANPLLYLDLGDNQYYPFTQSFMYSYPNVTGSASDESLFMDNYQDKYLLNVFKDYGAVTAVQIKSVGRFNFSETLTFPDFRTDLVESISGAPDLFYTTKMENLYKGNFWQSITDDFAISWKRLTQSFASNPAYNYVPKTNNGLAEDHKEFWDVYLYNDVSLSNGSRLFVYDSRKDTDFQVARYMARNMYASLTKNALGEARPSTVVLDHNYIFRNYIVEGLNGTLYSESLTKNIMNNSDMLVDSYGFFKELFFRWGLDTLAVVGNADGILGLKNPNEDSLFGPVLGVINDYLVYIFVVMMILFMIRYLKDRESIIRLVVFGAGAALLLLSFVKVFPTYAPMLYNSVVSLVNEDLSYDVLTLKTEKYSIANEIGGYHEAENTLYINGTTLTLYKFTDKQADEFMASMNIQPGTANSGRVYMVDSDNGIFFEGNELKINTDVLFKNNPITGSLTETEVGTVYQLKSEKMVSSVIDYYTPYHLIVDGLVDTLNNLPKVFKIPTNTLYYSGGLTKDSFLFYQYVNSAPFLSPANYTDPSFGFKIEEVNNLLYYYDNENFQSNSYDFLNLDRILSNSTNEMKETLWYQSMLQNGFLDDEARYWRLIESVNSLTKKFMIKLDNQSSLMSDENLVKVSALYASIVFNQKISEPMNWVYPSSLNYEDFILRDVYLSALSDSVDKFLAEDLELASYVVSNGSVLSAFILIGDLWLSWGLSWVFQFLLLFTYLLFVVNWLGRFALGKPLGGLLKGFGKSSLTLLSLATFYYSSFGIADMLSMLPALVFLFFAQAFTVYFLFMVVTAILFNVTEMGNGQFEAQLKAMNNSLSKMTKGMLDIGKLVNSVKNRRRYGNDFSNRYVDMYGFDSQMYGRPDLYYKPKRSRQESSRSRRSGQREDDYEYYSKENISDMERFRMEKERIRREQQARKDNLGG